MCLPPARDNKVVGNSGSAIVQLLIQSVIFHPTHERVSILIIAKSNKKLIVMNTMIH